MFQSEINNSMAFILTKPPAVMAQWLARPTRNHKVACSWPTTAMSLLGD
jgi:hypothetical protein